MDDLAKILISGSHEEFSKNIIVFLELYGDRKRFEELDNDDLHKDLWKALFSRLTNQAHSNVHQCCLSTLRILSRDKTKLNEIVTDEMIHIILENAGLTKICEEQEKNFSNVTIESLKLLYNLLFNCTKVQQSEQVTDCLPYLIERITKYNADLPYEIRSFGVRILFLITALNPSARRIVKAKHSGDLYLSKMLKELTERYQRKKTTSPQDQQITLICEVLKVLFNLYINSDDSSIEDKEKHEDLVKTLYNLLIMDSTQRTDELESNIVNLLTVIPCSCYSPIIPTVKGSSFKHIYEDRDTSAVDVLQNFLNKRLDCKENYIENISPIVTALVRLVKSERVIRKYIRLQVLPPLKDVMKRPEEGTTLRAKLCKLLTSPLTELRDLVAEFLFVLCKEDVNRMIKYTGYGNAAGMFANKGLLGRKQPGTTYSSDSEDSETEEYLKYKEQINPVTGCYEQPKPNPLAGMTEEQKEYEALQLVNLVDKLTKKGVVHPCRIGEDGKPKPIEHVLELQQGLQKHQVHRRGSDSD